MSGQFVSRRIASRVFSEGAQLDTIDLPRNEDYRALLIRIAGTYEIAGGALTALRQWYTDLIRRVQITVGGSTTLVDTSFSVLSHANFGRGFITDLARPVDTAIGVGNPFSASAIIDLQTIDGLRSADSNLHTHKLSLLQMVLNTGVGSDIGSGAGATVTVEAGTEVTVDVLETLESAEAKESANYIRKISRQIKTIESANSEMRIPLARGNQLRALVVRAISDGVPTDDMINRLTFQSGVDVRHSLTWSDTRALNKFDYRRDSTDQDGIAVIDFSPNDGRLSRLFDLSAVTEADLVLDVDHPGTLDQVEVTAYEYVTPAQAGQVR